MKLVDLTTAKVLYELGFNGEFGDVYLTPIDKEGKDVVLLHQYPKDKTPFTPAPRLDDAAYWIRDKYGISIDLSYTRENIRKGSKRSWAYILKEMDSLAVQYGDSFYCSYELALEAAVKKAIEIIKKQTI